MGIKTYKDGTHGIDYRDASGRRIRKKVGRSKKFTEIVLRARLKEVDEEKLLGIKKALIRKISFDGAVEKYMEWARSNKVSWKRDQQSLAHWQREFRGKTLSEICKLDIERYKQKRREQVAPRTVNEELACLRRLFYRMIDWDFAAGNPVKGIKFLRQPPGRLKILSAYEETRLLDACPPQLKPLVITALHTGMRLGEILALAWDDVDLNRNVIIVRNSKNNESREIPLTDTLRRTLLKLPGNTEKVFCSSRGTPYKSIRIVFENSVKRAGLEDFRFHDLRHVFASNLRMKGVDLFLIAEYLGHKTLAMTRRYAHVTTERKQEEIKRLDEPQAGRFLDTDEGKVVEMQS